MFDIVQADGGFTVKDVPIFEEHSNRGYSCDTQWLQDAIVNHQKQKEAGYLPMVTVGHNKKDQPTEKRCVAFLDNLVLKGKRLYADIVKVGGDMIDQLKSNEFPNRSVEVLPTSRRIVSMALLGGTTPHFTLPQMRYQEGAPGEGLMQYEAPFGAESTVTLGGTQPMEMDEQTLRNVITEQVGLCFQALLAPEAGAPAGAEEYMTSPEHKAGQAAVVPPKPGTAPPGGPALSVNKEIADPEAGSEEDLTGEIKKLEREGMFVKPVATSESIETHEMLYDADGNPVATYEPEEPPCLYTADGEPVEIEYEEEAPALAAAATADDSPYSREEIEEGLAALQQQGVQFDSTKELETLEQFESNRDVEAYLDRLARGTETAPDGRVDYSNSVLYNGDPAEMAQYDYQANRTFYDQLGVGAEALGQGQVLGGGMRE